MTIFNAQHTVDWDFQTAIATLDRKVMEDILAKQFYLYGVSSDIAYCTHKGVPFYLMRCENGVSYVCTKAQALYFMRHLTEHGFQFTLTDDATAFRVFPALENIQRKSKGTQYGTHYISLAKSTEYSELPGVLAL